MPGHAFLYRDGSLTHLLREPLGKVRISSGNQLWAARTVHNAYPQLSPVFASHKSSLLINDHGHLTIKSLLCCRDAWRGTRDLHIDARRNRAITQHNELLLLISGDLCRDHRIHLFGINIRQRQQLPL